MILLTLALACGQPAEEPVDQTAVVEAPAEAPAAEAAPAEEAQVQDDRHPALLDPTMMPAGPAPDTFVVLFDTTEGEFEVTVHREWAPNGADRFHGLVQSGYYDDVAFFRNVEGFMVQFGIHGDPAVNEAWYKARIEDDPVTQTNSRGRLTFATAGPNTRTTQLFINHTNNAMLDDMGFAPFGEVTSGMAVVSALYQGYGECQPKGRGPRQDLLMGQGNKYLAANYPELDYIKTARVK